MVVFSCDSVGLSVEDEPSTSDCIIDEEVLSGFEVESPWVFFVFNGIDSALTWSGTFSESDGDKAVVFGCWEECEEGRVLVGSEQSSKWTLQETYG